MDNTSRSRPFDVELDQLKSMLLEMGALVASSVHRSILAQTERSEDLAHQVLRDESRIDLAEIQIDDFATKLIATQQPVARDMRLIVATIKINTELERMGDLAKNIAKRVLFLTSCERIDLPLDFRNMATRAQWMVKNSLDALVNADTALAYRIREADDEVDALRRGINDTIEKQISLHPNQAEALLRLTSVSRHLERLADMACNVAEDVIYMVEGEIVRHHRTSETL
jgi:phosphate transport system protein